MPGAAGHLGPPAWQEDSRRLARGGRLKQRRLLGAVVYLLAVAAAFVYLAWLKREAQKVGAQVAAARPQLEFIAAQQRRWDELRAAIDPRYSAVEVITQATKALPSDQVRITDFTYTPAKWTLVGEAPSANLAIEYSDKLKAEPELARWSITSGSPTILKGEQARFSIEGRP